MNGHSYLNILKKIFYFLFFLPLIIVNGVQVLGLEKRSFSLRIRSDPETLDWNLAHTVNETEVLNHLMEGLVSFDDQAKIIPALAKKWTVSRDKKVYTFYLRSNVKWSDGIRLKAQDFLDSWKRLLSPLSAASYSTLLFDICGAQAFHEGTIQDFSQVGVKAIDDLTLQVILKEPVSYWIQNVGFWVTFPIRKDILEKYGNEWSIPGKIVTLGPYTLESHEPDSKIVLRANPTYYGVLGNVNQIIISIIKEDSLALRLYEQGYLDFISNLSLRDLHQWIGKPDLKECTQFKTQWISFGIKKYPLSNLSLRKAISMAIDRRKLCQFLRGGEIPASSLVPPGMLGYFKEIGLGFNLKQAKAELIRSGVDTGGLILNYGLPHWQRSELIGQFIKKELKKNLSLEVSLNSNDYKSYRLKMNLGAFSFFDFSWTADYSDPDTFLSLFLSKSQNNSTGWSHLDFDSLIFNARKVQSLKKREVFYKEAQKQILEEEVVITPLFYEKNFFLIKPRVKSGVVMNALGYFYLRMPHVAF